MQRARHAQCVIVTAVAKPSAKDNSHGSEGGESEVFMLEIESRSLPHLTES